MMTDQQRIWRVVIPVVLLVLVLGATLGMVWHHHVDCSPATCPLCHLTIEPSIAGIHICLLAAAEDGPESVIACPVARSAPQILQRGPPA